MRIIGIIMIVIGLFYAVAKPWFGSNFTGEEIARATVFDKSKSNNKDQGWRVSEIFLQGDNQTIRIRMNVLRLPGQIYDNGKLRLLVRVAPAGQAGAAQRPLLSEEITVSLEGTRSGGTSSTEPYLIFATSKEFTIQRSGQYKIGAIPNTGGNVGNNGLDIDANIIGIEAQVLSGVQATGSSNTLFGGALVVFGIVLMSIAKRRKLRGNTKMATAPPKPVATADPADNINPAIGRDEPPPAPPVVKPKPAPKTDVGKTIKWGRDAGKKR
ncbi:MAG: hypothetical protein L3J32_05795 [Rhizobiaceae bacterium]|nr:hypothetical protein [Rhizobiaceae bacterium]